MTKPSYEEPTHTELARCIAYFQPLKGGKVHDPDNASVSVTDAAAYAKHETERVRGLLQRQWIPISQPPPHPPGQSHSIRVLGVLADGGHVFAQYTPYYKGKDDEAKMLWTVELFPWAYKPTHWMPLPTFPQSSSLVPAGAESADIGKLDSADKAGVCNICGKKKMKPFPAGGMFIMMANHYYCIGACAGSAETGGEKAVPAAEIGERFADDMIKNLKASAVAKAPPSDWYEAERRNTNLQNLSEVYAESFMRTFPVKVPEAHRLGLIKIFAAHQRRVTELLANFPRSSQSQTVSSGVEGAHEGTAADKSEPEKLNNAHYDAITCTNDRSVALAESSLSSPPPEKEKL